MKTPVLLRVYENNELKEVKQFTDEQVVIGRGDTANLQLDVEGISTLHCVIEERESGYYISDLGSQSGTIKNGQKILDEAIQNGDQIEIGPYRIEFFVGVPKPSTPPTAEKPVAAPVGVESSSAASETPPPIEEKTEITEVKITQEDSGSDQSPPPIETQTSAKIPKESIDEEKTPVADQVPSQPVGSVQPAPNIPKSKQTFAPPSAFKDLKDVVKPSKGSVVEVVVAWKERIIASQHYNDKGVVTVGTHPDCSLKVPLFGSQRPNHPLVKIDNQAFVIFTQEMTGELVKENGQSVSLTELVSQGKVGQTPSGYEIGIGQGEMVRIDFGELVSIYVRYVPEAPKPLVAPLLDMTASEVTGVILATVVAAIFGLYMMIYSPSSLDDENRLEEPIRIATVKFTPPKVPKKVEKKIVQVKEKKPKKKKIVKVVKKAKKAQSRTSPGKKAPDVKPKKTRSKKKAYTSARSGGTRKTGPKKGANMATKKKDVSKTGLLGVFGTRGTQKKLDKTMSGSGTLQGLANNATGFTGDNENRPGDTIGTKLKSAGRGGKGTSTVGIAGGVGTSGKGSGNFGSGLGGLGKKGRVDINVSGQEAEFVGTIDREAIRRVILANIRSIRACYEKSLNRNPDLYGKLVLKWYIEDRGRVTKASVDSNTLGERRVASCIIRRLKSWTFPEPPPDQIAEVKYPFVFTSQ